MSLDHGVAWQVVAWHRVEEGCSQEEGPKKGFVMGSRTQGVQEILEKYI